MLKAKVMGNWMMVLDDPLVPLLVMLYWKETFSMKTHSGYLEERDGFLALLMPPIDGSLGLKTILSILPVFVLMKEITTPSCPLVNPSTTSTL